jgi:hypothetical protein
MLPVSAFADPQVLVGQQDKGNSLYAHESQGNVLDYLRRPSVSRLGCLSPLGTVRLLLVLALAKTMVVTVNIDHETPRLT